MGRRRAVEAASAQQGGVPTFHGSNGAGLTVVADTKPIFVLSAMESSMYVYWGSS